MKIQNLFLEPTLANHPAETYSQHPTLLPIWPKKWRFYEVKSRRVLFLCFSLKPGDSQYCWSFRDFHIKPTQENDLYRRRQEWHLCVHIYFIFSYRKRKIEKWVLCWEEGLRERFFIPMNLRKKIEILISITIALSEPTRRQLDGTQVLLMYCLRIT
jgi:hypothetical protein